MDGLQEERSFGAGAETSAASQSKSWLREKKILYQRLQNDNRLPATKMNVISGGQAQASSHQTQQVAQSPNDKLNSTSTTTNPTPGVMGAGHSKNQQNSGANHHHHHHHHHRHNHGNAPDQQPPLVARERRIGSLDAATGSDQATKSQHQHQSGEHHSQQPNTTMIGHYELKKTLGKGNFSTVKLAQHRILNHSVAIKVVKTSVLSEDNLMKVNREIDVLKKLGKHEHIVRLYQVIKTKRYFMLVTEYCANGELYDYLVDKGKLSEPQACNFFLQILSAIEYLHDRNIVHRDLKAENLLLTENYKCVKIADFGFANYFKRDKLLSTWCGSPPYAAPELFKGLQYVGPPVDIWSLGVILYVLVCGSLPFDGHNLVYLKSRVLSGKFRIPFFMSCECEGLVRGMLRLDPERRFSIKQIRAHTWIEKHGNSTASASATGTASALNGQPVPVVSGSGAAGGQSAKSSILSDTKSSKTHQSVESSEEKNANSTSANSMGANNRGQSLDLDDDKAKKGDKQAKAATKQVDGDGDASMLCLTSSTTTKVNSGQQAASQTQNIQQQQQQQRGSSKQQVAAMHNFVNTDIANAVSNMSIDSNNSSMSVSVHGNDTSNAMSTQSIGRSTSNSLRQSMSRGSDTSAAASALLNKQNSIDDQIIEFMVDNLKVADNSDSIRNSIANDKYDDLHAIYKLIRDQPETFLKSQQQQLQSLQQTANEFKIPSLPLISSRTFDSHRKPSITTGFVVQSAVLSQQQQQTPASQLPASSETPTNDDNKTVGVGGQLVNRFDFSQPLESVKISSQVDKDYSRLASQRETNANQTQDMVIDLATTTTTTTTTNKQQETMSAGSDRPLDSILLRQRKSDDQSWQNPPIFLTPPIETASRLAGNSSQQQQQPNNINSVQAPANKTTPTTTTGGQQARHSFDSTMQQIVNAQNSARLNLDKLSLSNDPKNNSWDSSLLDSLNASSSLLNAAETSQRSGGGNLTSGYLGSDSMSMAECSANAASASIQLATAMAGITTNLLQIGNQQTMACGGGGGGGGGDGLSQIGSAPRGQHTDLLLASLQTPAQCAATLTQSGLLPQMAHHHHGHQVDHHQAVNYPAGFMPNNLVNQNISAMNPYFPMQQNYHLNMNLPVTMLTNLNFLDPNGLNSGLERRASDGQASYNSLTNNPQSQPTSGAQMLSMVSQAAAVSPANLYSNHPHNHDPSGHQQQQQQQHHSSSSSFHMSPGGGRLRGSSMNSPCLSTTTTDSSSSRADGLEVVASDGGQTNHNGSNQSPDSVQQNPLDLSRSDHNESGANQIQGVNQQIDVQRFRNQLTGNPNRASDQRSNSTTSSSLIFPYFSAATTKSNANFISTSPRGSTYNNSIQIPFCQVSPSTISLSGGGPGHLLNRRKRHSLETESRHYHHSQLVQSGCGNSHHQNQPTGDPLLSTSPKCHLHNHENCLGGVRVGGSPHSHPHHHHHHPHHHHHHPLKYPAKSHLGQLRNFAQTFSYKNLMKNAADKPPQPPTQQQSLPQKQPTATTLGADGGAKLNANSSMAEPDSNAQT